MMSKKLDQLFRDQQLQFLKKRYANRIDQIMVGQETPLFVIDRELLEKQHGQLIQLMPRVIPHFAVKSCPSPEVLRIYKQLGVHLDVATSGELDILHALKYDPGLMIHTHPHNKPKDIKKAYDFGLRSFVFDSVSELDKFIPYKKHIRLTVRLSFPNKTARINLSYKFGMPPAEAIAAVAYALEMGFNVNGVAFHVGSQVEDPRLYASAIRQTAAFAAALQKQLGHKLEVLDIGGGFPAPYTHAVPGIQEFADTINPLLDELFADYIIHSEPGRYLVNPCIFTLSSVIGTSQREGREWLFIDDGIYGSFTDMMSGHSEYLLYALSEFSGSVADHHYVVGGPTCDSIDVIQEDAVLPVMQEGDVVLSPNMGAYSLALATEFNSIAKPQVIVYDAGKFRRSTT